jgi:hypothetical protein
MHKYLIVLLYLWLHNENHIYESGNCLLSFPPLTSGDWKPLESLYLDLFSF